MRLKTKFIRNFLSKEQYKSGKLYAIFIVFLCVFASHLYWNSGLKDLLAASTTAIFQNHEYWRLITSTFIHGDLEHLLSNSLMLFILSYFVAAFYGARLCFFLSLISGVLINFSVLGIKGGEMSLVGASGVVYFLWGFWLSLYLKLQTQYNLKGRLLRVGAITLILLVPTSYAPNVSYMAHFLGLVYGLFLGEVYFQLNKKHLTSFEDWEVKINLEELVPDENHNDFSRVE